MSISEFKKIAQKNANEPYWISRYLIRKGSIYFTYLCVKVSIKPNLVTLSSLILSIAGSIILLFEIEHKYLISALLIFGFYFLDHVDGELARYYSHVFPSKSGKINVAGKYFDRVVHYFQGSSFYVCLGASLFFSEGDIYWFILGLLGSIGSSGFPRFTACFDMLNTIDKARSKEYFDYIDKYSKFNVVHFSEEGVLTKKLSFPKNIGDLVLIARQLIGFPGNITIYFLVVIASNLIPIGNEIYMLYLLFYGLVLFINTIFATKKYLNILSEIPE
ncbi:CDP-alcohol phosphatidyltransferase family protein [Ekhidna sp.]|uniref:CDP-alcohol phosphatidyltransferase family protein n=1 Tax=Ekhidna sp. TaxID=2608089 RepID=UPI003CCBF177